MSALQAKIEQGLKTALLAGDKQTILTLRSLKNAILYSQVSLGRDHVIPEEAILVILQKEAKKRQESADLYRQGGSSERAAAELKEKSIIEQYLPKQLSEQEVSSLVDEVMRSPNGDGEWVMGPLIAQVRQRVAGRADCALIARVVKEKLDR